MTLPAKTTVTEFLAKEAGSILKDKHITEIQRFEQIIKLIYEANFSGYRDGLREGGDYVMKQFREESEV
jgi:hypothetical protein